MERRKNAYVYLVRESPEGATGRRDIVPKRSPFILDHKLFFEHIFNDRVVIPKDELTTLIHTSNQTIIEVFHYEEEAENPELLKVTLNKNNSAFKVFYFENQKWVSLTNKFETRSPVLNVRIRFKNKEFTFQFEMFNPFAEFQHPTFDKLMSCAKRHDFKKERDFEASKTYIRKQYFQCELEACEKATVKVNVNRDQGVIPFSVAKNLNFEMSEEKDEASDDLNAGFVKSTSKKGIDYSAELEGLSELVNKDRPSQGCRAIIEEEHHDQKNILGDEDCLESLNLSDELGDITEFQMLRSERNEANLSSKRKHLLIEQHMKEHTRGKEKNSPVREQSMEEVIHCCICYCNEAPQLKGELDCKHSFCYQCIFDWAKVTNSCPLCKTEFFLIFQKTINGTLIDEIPVEPKVMDEEEVELILENAEDRCYACQGEDNPDLMLVCDHCNVKVCHLSCLRPRLTEIPYAEWYCDYCVQTFNIRSLLPTARIFDTNRNRRRRQAEVRPPSRRRRLVRNPEPEEDQESSVEPEPPARSPSPEPVNNQRRNPRRNARNNYQPVMQNTAPRGNSRRNQNQNIQQVVQENPRTALQRNRRIFNQTIERTIRTPDDLIVRNQNAFEEEFTGLNIRRRVIDENML